MKPLFSPILFQILTFGEIKSVRQHLYSKKMTKLCFRHLFYIYLLYEVIKWRLLKIGIQFYSFLAKSDSIQKLTFNYSKWIAASSHKKEWSEAPVIKGLIKLNDSLWVTVNKSKWNSDNISEQNLKRHLKWVRETKSEVYLWLSWWGWYPLLYLHNPQIQ